MPRVGIIHVSIWVWNEQSMHEVNARSATVHDRTPFGGSAAVPGTPEPSPAGIDTTGEREVSHQDGVAALLRLAAAGAGSDPARARAGSC